MIKINPKIPYRIDLAGGWLDQPYVSKYCSGPVITISIEPTHTFNDRSGMATSTRKKAIELWGNKLPSDLNIEKLAKILFSYENHPGIKEISGSQDSIGIVFPGLNKLEYPKGKYWPKKIINVTDNAILNWLENLIYLIPLSPRPKNLKLLEVSHINKANSKRLSDSANKCFLAIKEKNSKKMGRAITNSFTAQAAIFPRMINKKILNKIKIYKDKVLGYKISGAGGGGYLILISETPIKGALKIKIRRKT